MRDTLRVLHIFKAYLNDTENWVFSLIDHLSNTDVVVASKRFLRCDFYPPKFAYLKFPLKPFENRKGLFHLKVMNKLVSYCLKSYPWYVMKACGPCDLMHSHFGPVGWEYMNLASRLKIPHVVSFYGSDYESLPFQIPKWERRYRQLFQAADLFLCEGLHGTNILTKKGCPPEKVRIARLGVRVDSIPFWKRKKNRKELHLLQIARFIEKKGYRHTIEAFKHAVVDSPKMTLTLIGGDPLGVKPELWRQIEGSPAEGKAFIHDAVNYDQVVALMEKHHVFIHPSHYTKEMDCEGGAPIVLLEAQATGMPIISTTHCDIPSEVIHEKTGLLCAEKDISALAGSITTFYNMGQEEYEAFARSAREHVQKRYNVWMTSRRVKEIYDDLCNTANSTKRGPSF